VTLLVLLAAIVVGACIAASSSRLATAVSPTRLHPGPLVAELKAGDRVRLDELASAVRARGDADWECALFEALEHEQPARDALVGEQLTELDRRAARWVRVPRACASISTSAGFLLAAVAMRSVLSDPAAFAEDRRVESVRTAVGAALDVGAMGICGTTFCIAAMRRARKTSRERAALHEELVERLERRAR
jgi:hypothetical protein